MMVDVVDMTKDGVRPTGAPEVLVLLSGGIDSAGCLAFYVGMGRPVTAMFVDYGQPAAQQEWVAARDLAEHFKVALMKTHWHGESAKREGLIPARNAFLLTAALMECPSSISVIAIGIHTGSSYEDCTSRFVQRMQSVFDLYSSGRVRVAAPFIDWVRAEVIDYCVGQGVPIGRTYSCECGEVPPCGRCLSCLDREAFHACS